MHTERGQDGCGPEDLPEQRRDVEEGGHDAPVALMERVEHRHVARAAHLLREEDTACV